MPEGAHRIAQRRLEAWRRSLSLFGKLKSNTGPFFAAGYTRYLLEPTLADGGTPDVLAAGRSSFVIADISISPHKDASEIRRYTQAQLTPFLRGRLGLPTTAFAAAAPFFLTPEGGRAEVPSDINAVNLTTSETYLPDIRDQALHTSWEAWEGFDERALPNYSILALPESEREEVKLAVAGAIRIWAAQGGVASAREIADLLLGDLSPSFTEGAKRRLTDNVAEVLHQAAPHLAPYARWEPNARGLAFTPILQASGRRALAAKIHTWLGTSYAVKPLEHYDSPSEEEEDDEDDE